MSLESNLSSIKQQLYGRTVPVQYGRLIAGGSKDFSFEDWASTQYSLGLYEDLLKFNRKEHTQKISEITDENLNPLGEFVKKKFKNAAVVDLASGPYSSLVAFAKTFGVERYIGVDIRVSDNYFRYPEGMESILLKDDMLRFTASLPDEQIDCFYISGIEGSNSFDWRKYESTLINETYRALKKGGMLLLGQNLDNDHLIESALNSRFREVKFSFDDGRRPEIVQTRIEHIVFVKP